MWAGILEAAGGFSTHHLSDDTAVFGWHGSICGQHMCTEVLIMPLKPGASPAGFSRIAGTTGAAGDQSPWTDEGSAWNQSRETLGQRLMISVGPGPVGWSNETCLVAFHHSCSTTAVALQRQRGWYDCIVDE